MVPLFAFDAWHYLYSIPLCLVSLFLILVILVQRGRGGGLTGALGGMGGQSAFGTKAGDLFTKITIVVAAIWILLSMLAIQRLGRVAGRRPSAPPATQQAEREPGKKKTDADETDAAPAGIGKSPAAKPDGANTVPVKNQKK
jgi:preprotein translocase subunit SecG